MKKALIVWGGWEGHEPQKCANIFAPMLRERGYEVEVSDTLDSYLNKEKLLALGIYPETGLKKARDRHHAASRS